MSFCLALSINNLGLIGATIPLSVVKEARKYSHFLCLIGKQSGGGGEVDNIPHEVCLSLKFLLSKQAS